MKAFIVDRYGKKHGARIGEMPHPELRQMTCGARSTPLV